MAKRDCDRRGYLKREILSKKVTKLQLGGIELEARKKIKGIAKPQLGPRALAWNEFKRSGKIDRAYEEVVKVYGEKSFAKSLICKWINEEMQKEEQKREDLKGSSYDEAR